MNILCLSSQITSSNRRAYHEAPKKVVYVEKPAYANTTVVYKGGGGAMKKVSIFVRDKTVSPHCVHCHAFLPPIGTRNWRLQVIFECHNGHHIYDAISFAKKVMPLTGMPFETEF